MRKILSILGISALLLSLLSIVLLTVNIAATTLDLQVGASGDDGYSRTPSVSFDNTSNILVIGKSSPSPPLYDAFARFTDVTVPEGATIDVAYISVMAKNTNFDGSGVKSNLHLEAADSPTAPTTQASHAGRTRTTNFTAWDDYDFPDTTNFYNSPSIVSAVGEVVNRSGWNSGQSMLILWDNDGSSDSKTYRPRTYDDDSTKALKLHIEYTSGVTCEALTVIVNNPADQMYFNGTTDTPTGGLWQEENVSEDFQTAVTPAINVTNDEGSGTCDVTLELLTSPGSGRTMKFSLTNTAPNPGVNSIPVGSNTTAVSSLGSGSTQAIYLWVDYDDSQGGSVSPTLRVDTELP